MNPHHTPKLGQSDLLYGSKSPVEKCGREQAFFSQLNLTLCGLFVNFKNRGADKIERYDFTPMLVNETPVSQPIQKAIGAQGHN